MKGFKAKVRVAVVAILAVSIGLTSLYGLLKPMSNGCVMTYMYPTYIPISMPENMSSTKYSLYLYHVGWKKIDFDEHLKNLNGISFLSGGNLDNIRSLGTESDRAYQSCPLERHFYQAFPYLEEGVDTDSTGNMLPNQYTSMLDWFAVDLEALMFVPSLVAWLQRIGICQNFPHFWDCLLITGVILYGISDSKPELNFFLFPIPGFPLWEIRLSFGYLLAGYFSFISALALYQYMVFYPMAAIGVVSFAFRVMQRRNIKNGETYHGSRKHSHRH